jgi:hypothetical protein
LNKIIKLKTKQKMVIFNIFLNNILIHQQTNNNKNLKINNKMMENKQNRFKTKPKSAERFVQNSNEEEADLVNFIKYFFYFIFKYINFILF